MDISDMVKKSVFIALIVATPGCATLWNTEQPSTLVPNTRLEIDDLRDCSAHAYKGMIFYET